MSLKRDKDNLIEWEREESLDPSSGALGFNFIHAIYFLCDLELSIHTAWIFVSSYKNDVGGTININTHEFSSLMITLHQY